MLKKVALALVVLLAVLGGFIASREAAFRYERRIQIAAPAAVVYGFVDDFHRWETWSPWEKMDPQMKRSHSGAAKGVGAVYGWVGNNDVGEGRMTITDATPAEKLAIKLEFLKPMAMTNTARFGFTEAAGVTTVVWSMEGENNFVGKAFATFADVDKMIGGDFERGLAALKQAAEAAAKAAPAVPAAPAVEPSPSPAP